MKIYNLVDLKTQEICGKIILEDEENLIKIKVVDDYFKVVKKIIEETNERGGFKVKIDDDLNISDFTGEFWLCLKQNLFRYLETITELIE